MTDYKSKYLKYKSKYLELKIQVGGNLRIKNEIKKLTETNLYDNIVYDFEKFILTLTRKSDNCNFKITDLKSYPFIKPNIYSILNHKLVRNIL